MEPKVDLAINLEKSGQLATLPAVRALLMVNLDSCGYEGGDGGIFSVVGDNVSCDG